jgi:hypothetical protein
MSTLLQERRWAAIAGGARDRGYRPPTYGTFLRELVHIKDVSYESEVCPIISDVTKGHDADVEGKSSDACDFGKAQA